MLRVASNLSPENILKITKKCLTSFMNGPFVSTASKAYPEIFRGRSFEFL